MVSSGGCSLLVTYKYDESMSKNGVLKCMQISSLHVSLTTPLAAGVCSARVDGARIGSAACVRIALIPSRAGAHLFQKVNSLFQHDFSPLYCRLTYSPRWCHRGMGNRGQKGPRELLGPGAWAGLGVGLVFGVGSH